MISSTEQPLNATDDTELRTWLGKSGAKLMEKVIESKVHANQLKHLEKAMEGSQFPLKLESSSDELKSAMRYQTFLDIWRELSEQPSESPFTTIKITQ